LSTKAQCVYDCLKRHCNANRKTNVGTRRISEERGINLETAKKGITELIKKGFIKKRTSNSANGVYYIYALDEISDQSLSGNNPLSGRQFHPELDDNTSQKELKNYIKEEERQHLKPETLDKFRRELENKGLLRRKT